MNQIRIILVGLIFIGTLLVGIGVYLVYNQNNEPQPIASAAPELSVAPAKISKILTVPSTVMWYDTGITIPNNATLTIEYKSGHWTNAVGSNFVDGQGKQFERRHLLIVPGSYLAALVAKVGDYSFPVGNSYNGKPGSGKLYLSLNDIPKTYDDNQGELDVAVSVK